MEVLIRRTSVGGSVLYSTVRPDLTSRAECFRQRLVLRSRSLGLFLIASFTMDQVPGRCTVFIAFQGVPRVPSRCPFILSELGGEPRGFGAHSSESVACRISSELFKVQGVRRPWSSGLHFDGQSPTWQLFLYILQGYRVPIALAYLLI